MQDRQAHLDNQLHLAWQQGVLSFQEAWRLQDQFLLATDDWIEMPPELEPEASRLALWHVPAENKLPL